MERDIAMVFQNYALYPHMSVFDNMAYGLRNRGTPKAEIETRVKEAARILELEALLERKPRQLSGGQRQRVAMGRAIVRKPAAFLFDEPLSNLDAKLRVQMRIEIRKLQRALKTTSIYVTHDQLEAMTLADRLVVMNGGRMEQVGTALDVFQQARFGFRRRLHRLAADEFPSRRQWRHRAVCACTGGALLAYDPALHRGAGGSDGARRASSRNRRASPRRTAKPRRRASRWSSSRSSAWGASCTDRIGERAFTVAQGASDAPPQGEAFIDRRLRLATIHLFDAATGVEAVASASPCNG